jgi:FixJ family two-component response regulator
MVSFATRGRRGAKGSKLVELPFARGRASSLRAPGVITIGLADDQHLVRQGIRCLLELEKDFRIIGETGDGTKVAGLVGRVKPSVLIVALVMPGLNGVEIARQVRRQSPETGVVILSVSTEERYVVEALRSGASGYLVKQAKATELIRAVRRVARAGHDDRAGRARAAGRHPRHARRRRCRWPGHAHGPAGRGRRDGGVRRLGARGPGRARHDPAGRDREPHRDGRRGRIHAHPPAPRS